MMKMKQKRIKVQNHMFSLKQILNGVIITKQKKMLSTAKEKEETKLTRITQKTVYLKKMNIVRGKYLENTFKTLFTKNQLGSSFRCLFYSAPRAY